MGRRAKIQKMRQAERILALHRVRCQSLAVQPTRFLQRNSTGIMIGSGLSLGLLCGRPAGRRVASTVISLSISFMKLQPRLIARLARGG